MMSFCQNTLIGNSFNLISTKANNGDDSIDDIMNGVGHWKHMAMSNNKQK